MWPQSLKYPYVALYTRIAPPTCLIVEIPVCTPDVWVFPDQAVFLTPVARPTTQLSSETPSGSAGEGLGPASPSVQTPIKPSCHLCPRPVDQSSPQPPPWVCLTG